MRALIGAMLELRPSCEHCAVPLAADAPGAYICSFECTFCAACAAKIFQFTCPNCGGTQLPRPYRSVAALVNAPASQLKVEKPANLAVQAELVASRLVTAGRRNHLWEVVVDCANPSHLADFYGALFGVPVNYRADDWAYLHPYLRGAELYAGNIPAAGVRLAFQKVPEGKLAKNRLHLDVGVFDLPDELSRAVSLGAAQLGPIVSDEHGRFVVLADPEGNEFCLIDP